MMKKVIVYDSKIYVVDEKDEWITINGAAVHLDKNGVPDKGAEGKFNGMKRGGRMQYMKGNRPQDQDKNHPYWKTHEGKAEAWFSNRMASAEHGTYTRKDKINSIAEAASKKVTALNSSVAEIDQQIARINNKRGKLTKDDEARLKSLGEKRQQASKEANAFHNEWRRWKAENKVEEPEHFKRTTVYI